jgi:hypothetical protein
VGRQVHESSYGPALLLTDIQGIEDHLGDMDFKVGCQESRFTFQGLASPAVGSPMLWPPHGPACLRSCTVSAVLICRTSSGAHQFLCCSSMAP